MKKYAVLSVLLVVGCGSMANAGTPIGQFFDSKGEVVTLEQIDRDDIANGLKEQQVVFDEAFWAARVYSGHAVAGDETAKKEFLEKISSNMDEVKALLTNSKVRPFGVSARKDGVVIGILVFSQEAENVVYINQGAIHPNFWRRKIMTYLVKKIVDFLPETKKIVFVTRKSNRISTSCYESLMAYTVGDVPVLKESPYTHPGYDPEIYQGYECVLSPEVLDLFR